MSSDDVQPAELDAITDWLVSEGLRRVPLAAVVSGLCERLVAAGVPLWRVFVSWNTLHPQIQGVGTLWHADHGIETRAYEHRSEPYEAYARSPFQRMLDLGDEELRIRLSPSEAAEFPAVEEMRQRGATDYLAHRVYFGVDGKIDRKMAAIASWATCTPGGFRDRDLGILRRIMPRLALVVEAWLGYELAANLLDTYVGSDAGRRILDGDIRRGTVRRLVAVILYADLRGFTTLADRHDGAIVVDALNAYFEEVVSAIDGQGGEVLKYFGDGLVAIFALGEREAPEVCERALAAAVDALRRVRRLSEERARAGRPALQVDIVLHLGEVVQGNVGGASRLDFAVIGPALNEASRIEALCRQYERHLLVSETLWRAAGRAGERLTSIGRFALRGVRAAQTIYTLDWFDESLADD